MALKPSPPLGLPDVQQLFLHQQQPLIYSAEEIFEIILLFTKLLSLPRVLLMKFLISRFLCIRFSLLFRVLFVFSIHF